MITLSLVGDRELVAKLNAMPEKIRASLVREVTKQALLLERHVKTQKLMGQVLQKRTGRLMQSIQGRVSQATATAVMGRVYSAGDVKYAGIHEYGGATPPHLIEARKAKALAFGIGGKTVFARSVNHPGSKMPERSFLRSSLTDRAPEIKEALTRAVKEGLKK